MLDPNRLAQTAGARIHVGLVQCMHFGSFNATRSNGEMEADSSRDASNSGEYAGSVRLWREYSPASVHFSWGKSVTAPPCRSCCVGKVSSFAQINVEYMHGHPRVHPPAHIHMHTHTQASRYKGGHLPHPSGFINRTLFIHRTLLI